MKDIYKKEFSLRLREVEKESGMTRKDLSAIAEVKAQTFKSYLDGNALPNSHVLATFATKLNIDLNWLILGEGTPYKKPLSKKSGIDSTAQTTTDKPTEPHIEITDLISQRITVATKNLRESGAPETMIQEAIMTILKSAEQQPPANENIPNEGKKAS